MPGAHGEEGRNFRGPGLAGHPVLLPDDFAENVYHACGMHSIIQSGLIPGGKSNRKDRQSMFFTAVNGMDSQPDQREVEYDLDKPRIAPYKHTWRSHHTVFWCNLKVAQRERNCDSIKLDRMQLLFQTHNQRFVSIKWFA